MTSDRLAQKAVTYLQTLCLDIPHRRVGSPGNRLATGFFAEKVAAFGFDTDCPQFNCLDWNHGEIQLTVGSQSYEAYIGPYSLGCHVRAPLAVASTIEELETIDASSKILLLHGEIAKEQLMPKNFKFYNPEHHQQIYRLLEAKQPLAIIAATSRNPELAGGIYPFPLIEDGDFDIPSAYMKDIIGDRLAQNEGREIMLDIDATRIPATGCNVLARKGINSDRKIVLCAHIDAKENTPGALDNASGVVTLLLLAELLAGYSGELEIEIVAFNGEDDYSAAGQVHYLQSNQEEFDQISLAINLDGVGYHLGKTAYSLYDCPSKIAASVRKALSSQKGTLEGDPWYQSDHMIFVQSQVPAVAITSTPFTELWTEIAHTSKDTPDIIDTTKLVDMAVALRGLILALN